LGGSTYGLLLISTSPAGLSSACSFETQLEDAYPERFAGTVPRPHAEFATTYIFSFLEACVARCARDENFDATRVWYSATALTVSPK